MEKELWERFDTEFERLYQRAASREREHHGRVKGPRGVKPDRLGLEHLDKGLVI